MAEEQQTMSGEQSAVSGQQSGEGEPEPVPYKRFKEVNDAFNDLKTRLEKIETDKRAAEESQLTEQKKWEDLAKKREGELKAERTERLRLKAATAKGLPVELAGRLIGETEEELAKDAETLLAFLKPREGPGVPPPNPNGKNGPLDYRNMTPEEVRKNAAKIVAQRKS